MGCAFNIIEATGEHKTDILDLLISVAHNLQHRKQSLWPTSMFTPKWLDQRFSDSLIYCAFDQKKLVGFVLLQEEDKYFWPEKPRGEAYYLHKLCVHRDYKGMGVSVCLIDTLIKRTKKDGKTYLRLDCDPRPALLKLYKELGFQKIDQKIIENFTSARFEKKV